MTSDSGVALAPAIRLPSDARTASALKNGPSVADARRAPQSPESEMPASLASAGVAEAIDRSLHASIARFTAGLSPAALAAAYFDWATHLAASPGKRVELAEKAARKATRFFDYACRCALERGGAERCIEPLPQDRRFAGEFWQQFPFNSVHQGFLLNQQWWHVATTGIRGVSRHHEDVVEFASRQMLDMFSPSNFLLTIPKCFTGLCRRAAPIW
jgi:polyhydroxyalkanoate synthase